MEVSKRDIKSRDMAALAVYRNQLYVRPDLRCLFIELTDNCNLRCLHCGSNCGPEKAAFISTEMVLDFLKQLKEDFSACDFMICLTGGEPLLHPGFQTIVKAINDCDIPWGMTTNATLIDEKVALMLKNLGMGSISISIDGLKDSHEWLRRVPGCFDKAVEGIKNLQKEGHRVQVTTVVSKKNLLELERLYEFMTSIDVDSWRVVNLEPIGRANTELQDASLNVEEIKSILYFIREKRFDPANNMDIRYGCSHYLSFGLEREVRDYYFLCGAGTRIASILVNGDIYGCLDIERRKELVQGNISKDRFKDVWVNGYKNYRIDRSELCNDCKHCKEREFCAGDSMHTWDFDRMKPRMCMLMG